jgi:protoheme IX farnesyltransferase
MKVSASSSSSSVGAVTPADKSLVMVLCELVKARLTLLVVLTTAVGFYVGWRGAMEFWLLLHTLSGTALVACGAAALNQWWEREHDARMRRTAERPLPSGRLQAETVLVIGGVVSAGGLVYLALAVNVLTALLAAATFVSYVFIYTPLKRVTWLNTAIGAVPGALPPLMGWTAARGELSAEGWGLFAILFFWQIPHFLAIAWLYREDYEKAGFVMLPSVDPEGFRTGRQAVSHALGLLMVSLTPFLFRLTGLVYLAGALLLGVLFVFCALQFSRQLNRRSARQLFLVIDKLRY